MLTEAERLIAAPDDPMMGRIHNTVGEVAFAHGDYVRAEQGYRDLLELVTEQYGSDHLWVASAHGNLGEVALARNRLDEARSHFERALEIRARILGTQSYWVAHTWAHLGDVALRRRELDRAQDYYRKVLDAPPHPSDPAACDRTVWANHGLALAALDRGQLDVAWQHAERTLQADPKPDPAHLDLCDRFDVHARILLARDEPDAALEHLLRVRNTLEDVAGPDHRNLVPVLTAEAETLRVLGRQDQAQRTLARARAIHERDPANDPLLLAR